MRSTISFEDMLHGREKPNRLLTDKIETQRQVQSLRELAETVKKRVKDRSVTGS